MNEPFVLGWRTEGATRIELFTEAGPVPSASETMLAGELSDLRIAEDTEFVLRAHDGLGGYVEERLTVSVEAPEIEALEFAPAFVAPGGTVELSWAVLGDPQGAEVSLSLTDGEGGEYDLSGKSVVEDRLTLTLERPGIHSFTLKAWSEIGEDERTAEVVVDDTPSVTLTASTAEYDGREPVTLSWTVTPNVEWTPTVYLPMREVDSPFVDISTRPNVVDLFEAGADDSITWFSFAEGFLFPWGGELHSGVAVSSDGFLSFDPAAWPYHWNGPLPDRVRGEVHLAPFWDDIRAPGGGRILAAVLEDGSHVIQWSKMDRYSRGADLNFQVVLFPDGAIEYRYGTMAPGCIDELEANGSSATIGYQNPSGSVWYVLHYGADAVAFPGGLENRSFRMDAGVAGSVTLHPTATGVYPVCAEVAGYRTCEVLEVGVLSP